MDELYDHEKSGPEDPENGPRPASKIIEPIKLTDRDVAIFKFAHEHRYLVYNQISRAFWKDRSEIANACYGRVEQLVNAEYLRKGYSTKKSSNVYFVTEKSFAILKERGLDSDIPLYQQTKRFDTSIDHDLKVISIRILFRELGLDSWTSERMLRERDHLYKRPDGVLNLRGKRIAIELENHLSKSKKRYQALFDYYSNHKTYLVLLLVIDGHVKDWLIDVLKYNAKRIWMTTYWELLNKKEETLFENKQASFKLSRLM